MSANKQTRAINRAHDRRVIRNQTNIYVLYNDRVWLASQKPSSFRKGKAMNCSCGTCRGWGKSARKFRLVLQLEKAGMCEKQHLSNSGFRNRVTKEWAEEYEGL